MCLDNQSIKGGLFLFLLLINFSCYKKYKCEANCADVIFSGLILDKANNRPLANQLVSIKLSQNTPCLLCGMQQFISGKSGRDGRFFFQKPFDSTILSTRHFNMAVKTPENYLLYPQPTGPGMSTDQGYANASFYTLDAAAMTNLTFVFYEATTLKLNLHRTTPINTSNPHIGIDMSFGGTTSVWGMRENQTNGDTSLTYRTSINLYTVVKTTKMIGSTYVTQLDSVLCRKGQQNVLDISY